MPAPVMHIVLSLLILPLLPDKDSKEFILGASFPDIRYLGIIDRRLTHKAHPSWDHIIKEKSSFKAGMEFHALVDVMHDKYMACHQVKNLLPVNCQESPNYLKFFEDMLVYTKVSEWKKIAGYFDLVINQEKLLVNDSYAIELWHSYIKHYILQQPAPKTVQQLLDIEIPTWYGWLLRLPVMINAHYVASILSDNILKLFHNKILCNCILDFYDQFPTMLIGTSEIKAQSDAKITVPLQE